MSTGIGANPGSKTFGRLQDYFCREKPVPAAYLFGSRSAGSFSNGSDIDVAVVLPWS